MSVFGLDSEEVDHFIDVDSLSEEGETNDTASTFSGLSVSEDLESVVPQPEGSKDIDINNLQKVLTPNERPSCLPPRKKKEEKKITKEIMEMNRSIQRKLIEDLVKKKKRNSKRGLNIFKKSEDKKRTDLIKKMRKQFNKSVEQEEKMEQSTESYEQAREQFLQKAAVIWKNKILPNFKAMRLEKSTIKLWKCGIPPSVRGEVWRREISASCNQHTLTLDFYSVLQQRTLETTNMLQTQEQRQLIELDLRRTFPQLMFFQKNGPYHQQFMDVLECWVKYRTDIGYVQGMSYLVAMLLLNMDHLNAFQVLSNLLLSKKYHFYEMYTMKKEVIDELTNTFKYLLREKLRKLYAHFKKLEINFDVCLIDWFMTLYAKSFPLAISTYIWDLYLIPDPSGFGGEKFLYKVALGIFLYYRKKLLKMDFDRIMYFLSHLSHQKNIDKRRFFRCVAKIKIKDKLYQNAKKRKKPLDWC